MIGDKVVDVNETSMTDFMVVCVHNTGCRVPLNEYLFVVVLFGAKPKKAPLQNLSTFPQQPRALTVSKE